MDYSTFLQTTIRQYIDEHLSCNVEQMAKHIYHEHAQFKNITYSCFKNTVKTALEYIQFVDSIEDESTQKKGDILPYMRTSDELKRSSRRKKASIPELERLKKKRESVKKKQFPAKDDCFIIDVEGNHSEPANAEVSILYSKEQAACPTPVGAPSKSTPVAESSTRKRLLPDDATDKLHKKMMLSKMLTEKVQDVELSQLGGLDFIKESVYSVLVLLQLPQPRPVSLLISGPPGAGKTALACAMAKAASLPVVQLRLCDVVAASSTLTPEKKIAEEFFNSVTNGPALVLISQFDQLSRDGGSHSIRNLDKGVSRLLCTMIDNLTSEASKDPLLVVAECSHVELLDPKLLDCFSEHIVIKPPSAALRLSILQAVCSTETLHSSVDLEYFSLKCSGFLAGDFVRLLKHARRMATKRCLRGRVAEAMKKDCLPYSSLRLPNYPLIPKDFLDAFKLVTPTLKKEGFPTVPETTWQDVGGLKDVREELRRKMLDPIKEPDLLAKYNKTSSGILLWGPPGCGKTLLAKAVANEAGVNLLIVNGPDLLSMYQGESERAVRVVFARAASVAPCVIFFDEFDSLCPKRSKTGSESGSKSTIVNTLLTEMSGFMERSGVYVMAATNLPGILDPAVLRPGRFDTLLYVGLPDVDSREAVLRAATKNGTLPALASDVNLRTIAEQCEHFSGADCRHLVETASTESFEELKVWRQARALQQTKSASATLHAPEDSSRGENPTIVESVTKACSTKTSSSTVANCSDVKENTRQSVTTCFGREDSDVIALAETSENLDLSPGKSGDEEWETTDEDEEIAAEDKMDQDNGHSLQTPKTKEAPFLGETPVKICSSNLKNPFLEGEYVLYARHFAAALKKVNPSVSGQERQKYEDQRRLKKFI